MKLLIVANWKCNPLTFLEVKSFFNNFNKEIRNVKKSDIVVCPPFIYLDKLGASAFAKGLGGLAFGSQDCFWEEEGAFTGEISAPMLKNLGIKYVIVGHSERRRYFGETDETVNKKLKAVIKADLKPILCIGETDKERKKGITNQVIQRQLVKGLKDIQNFSVVQRGYRRGSAAMALAIAYEPVWAIGTGNPCLIEDAKKTFLFIQKILEDIYSKKIAKSIRILYGGSVNSKNAAGYIKEAGMQGLLVGGASLDPKEFVEIIKSCEA